MKAPLRLVFGWVLYVALFMAISPAVRACIAFAEQFPLDGVVTAMAALVALIGIYLIVGRRFYRWLDEPRARS